MGALQTQAAVARTSRALSRFCALLLVATAAQPAATANPGSAAQDANAAGLEEGVDAAIAPGDDFFGFANGAWLRNTPLPPGATRWGARQEIAQRSAQQVAQVVQTAHQAGAAQHGRQVAAFYAAYLDEAGIESRGLTPIAPLLHSVDRLRDKVALARWLGAHLRADVDPLSRGVYNASQLFGLAVSYGMHGETDHIAYLLQGGLGLGDREWYVAPSAVAQEARQRYRQRLVQRLQRMGPEGSPAQAARRADAVLALEVALARGHAGAADLADERNADNRWQRADFAVQAPGLNWPVFFAAAGLGTQATIVAWQPAAIKASATLVAAQPLSVWKDYLRLQIVQRFAEVLPRVYRDSEAMVTATAATGAATSAATSTSTSADATPRAQRAIAATEQALPDAVAQLYVQRFFPAQAQATAQAMLDAVAAAFARRVAALPWMTPATRQTALDKLQAVYFGIGHPPTWPDASALHIDARDAVGNQLRIDAWNRQRALARLAQPVDRRAWGIDPQTPGATLNFQLNAHNFAAALLQPPKFDAAASEAANLGAIGAIFAHELSHFVDVLGADHDARGALQPWWTAQDKAAYAAAADALVQQFAAYEPVPGAAIDGRRTLTENVADLTGLATAFDAHRRALASRAGSALADPADLRQQDRAFFIGFARAWRIRSNEAALRTQLATDSHAPERWRVATVRNLDAWYDAFDVRPGHKLYLAPAARVRIW